MHRLGGSSRGADSLRFIRRHCARVAGFAFAGCCACGGAAQQDIGDGTGSTGTSSSSTGPLATSGSTTTAGSGTSSSATGDPSTGDESSTTGAGNPPSDSIVVTASWENDCVGNGEPCIRDGDVFPMSGGAPQELLEVVAAGEGDAPVLPGGHYLQVWANGEGPTPAPNGQVGAQIVFDVARTTQCVAAYYYVNGDFQGTDGASMGHPFQSFPTSSNQWQRPEGYSRENGLVTFATALQSSDPAVTDCNGNGNQVGGTVNRSAGDDAVLADNARAHRVPTQTWVRFETCFTCFDAENCFTEDGSSTPIPVRAQFRLYQLDTPGEGEASLVADNSDGFVSNDWGRGEPPVFDGRGITLEQVFAPSAEDFGEFGAGLDACLSAARGEVSLYIGPNGQQGFLPVRDWMFYIDDVMTGSSDDPAFALPPSCRFEPGAPDCVELEP